MCVEVELMVEPMMTARQVAEFLGLHENWVYDRASSGDLPSYKLGGTRRFRREEIEAWLTAQRDAPAAAPVVATRAPHPSRLRQPKLFGEGQ
jgi:excisionase family DNA binding protein